MPEEETLNAEDTEWHLSPGSLEFWPVSCTEYHGNLLGNDASSSWDKEHLWETA